MKTKKIFLIAGARPNFMKIAPIARAFDAHNAAVRSSSQNGAAPSETSPPLQNGAMRSTEEVLSSGIATNASFVKGAARSAGGFPNNSTVTNNSEETRQQPVLFNYKIIHTGQHYDAGMSDVFFEELGIPEPDYNLGVGSGSHAEQTARIMVAFEKICLEDRPDMVMVVGDVNSTLACAIVAKKLCIEVAHVEAGLRSGDMTMPEEINRIVTDSITDHFFVTEPSGVENLKREGHPDDRIHFVGHVMIDNLFYQVEKLKHMDVTAFQTNALKQQLGHYGVVTLHRPSNVDDKETLARIMGALGEIAQKLPLIFAVHPRTRANMKNFGIDVPKGFHLTGPLPYMEFLNLWKDSRVVLTDSGGVQEETTALGVACITIRESTERPITVSDGTNVVVGTDRARIVMNAERILAESRKHIIFPPLWDGDAAKRVACVVCS